MGSSLHLIRVYTKQLQRNCGRVKDRVWTGSRDDLVQALADTAEVNEVSRRLWLMIQEQLK